MQHNGFPLSEGRFLLMALLCRGDYENGLEFCGPSTLLALVQCRFGDKLCNAFITLECPAFNKYLIQWHCSLQTELCSNMHGFLKAVLPHVADIVPDNFPSYKAINLYVNPLLSWSPNHTPLMTCFGPLASLKFTPLPVCAYSTSTGIIPKTSRQNLSNSFGKKCAYR